MVRWDRCRLLGNLWGQALLPFTCLCVHMNVCMHVCRYARRACGGQRSMLVFSSIALHFIYCWLIEGVHVLLVDEGSTCEKVRE